MTPLDPEFGRAVLENFLEVFVTPEIARRQADGRLPTPVALSSAQVIMYPDGRPNLIRVNDEVRAIARVKPLVPRAISPGDPVYESEIASVEGLSLPPEEDRDAGHFTAVRLRSHWYVSFDFRYNKGRIQEHLAAASEFLASARSAIRRKHYRAMAEALFAASELSAKSLLLSTAQLRPGRSSRKSVHGSFNVFARSGNLREEQRSVFNALSDRRPAFRYLERDFAITREEARHWLKSVALLLEYVQHRSGCA